MSLSFAHHAGPNVAVMTTYLLCEEDDIIAENGNKRLALLQLAPDNDNRIRQIKNGRSDSTHPRDSVLLITAAGSTHLRAPRWRPILHCTTKSTWRKCARMLCVNKFGYFSFSEDLRKGGDKVRAERHT